MLTMSNQTWKELVEENGRLVTERIVEPGVFATGVGPSYKSGGLLYVGKSAGPLGNLVGSGGDQAESIVASTSWMIERRNRSAFWQLVDLIDPTRRTIAWTNISKMDERGGGRPPREQIFLRFSAACLRALKEEMLYLQPKVSLFATSHIYGRHVDTVLQNLGFVIQAAPIEDGITMLLSNRQRQHVLLTRHPQGWTRECRDRVVTVVKSLLVH